MDQTENQPNEQPHEQWQKDRQNKEMRLWELGGKGDILSGWWEIIKATIALLLIIGLLIYGIYTKQLHQYFQGASLSTILLIIAFVILSLLYRIGLGIWEIYLGKSKLLRKQWTWWYTIITMPLAYIYLMIRLFYPPTDQTTPLIQIIIIASGTLAFGVLYYYVWTIRRKFEPAAVEPIKEELQELSRWPTTQDRPTFIFLLSIIFMFIGFSLAWVNGIMGASSIFDSSGPTGSVLIGIITGFLAGVALLVSGIGLMRMKKYGFVSVIFATILLGAMALQDMGTGWINIYFYGFIGVILAVIYLYFEKEKLN